MAMARRSGGGPGGDSGAVRARDPRVGVTGHHGAGDNGSGEIGTGDGSDRFGSSGGDGGDHGFSVHGSGYGGDRDVHGGFLTARDLVGVLGAGVVDAGDVDVGVLAAADVDSSDDDDVGVPASGDRVADDDEVGVPASGDTVADDDDVGVPASGDKVADDVEAGVLNSRGDDADVDSGVLGASNAGGDGDRPNAISDINSDIHNSAIVLS
jgi:hypothetical protein